MWWLKTFCIFWSIFIPRFADSVGGALKCTGDQTLYGIRYAQAKNGKGQLQAVCRKPPVLCKKPDGSGVPGKDWNTGCSGKPECSDGEFINGFETETTLWCCKIPDACPAKLGTQRKAKLDPGGAMNFNPELRKDGAPGQGEGGYQMAFVQQIFAGADDESRRARSVDLPSFYMTYVLVNGLSIQGQALYEATVADIAALEGLAGLAGLAALAAVTCPCTEQASQLLGVTVPVPLIASQAACQAVCCAVPFDLCGGYIFTSVTTNPAPPAPVYGCSYVSIPAIVTGITALVGCTTVLTVTTCNIPATCSP